MKVSREIERLEITMNILEAKLASIPGLEGSVPSTNQPMAPQGEEMPSIPIPPPAPMAGGASRSNTYDDTSSDEEEEDESPRINGDAASDGEDDLKFIGYDGED